MQQTPHHLGRAAGDGWRPLWTGAEKGRAEGAIEAIVTTLNTMHGTLPACLASGAAGMAVLHGHLDCCGFRSAASAECWLERAVGAMTATEVTAALFSGLTGIGWAVEHLRPKLHRLHADAINDEIDDALGELLLRSPWDGEYDLVSGLVGYGVYALERLPRPRAQTHLERLVDHLAATAVRQADGVTWWTDPVWLLPEGREQSPRGCYGLGLAHGVACVIAFLGCVCGAGVAVERARPLLDDAVHWLLAQQPSDGQGFTHWIEPGRERPRKQARLAWCYGDLGIAAALLLASRCVENLSWEDEAIRIARRAAARPFEESGVKDAGLCHGSAGLGHLFNRMYQATGDPSLGEAARCWFKQTLEMRQPDRGIAGYVSWWGGFAGGPEWIDDPGVLTGAAGIALTLQAACTDIEPDWDRMLLVSVPPG